MTQVISFTEAEQEQYDRHFRLKDFGIGKQERLKSARVLIIGAGGLGCPIGLYLAAAGVGTIGIADFDRIERSNLQRQIAHTITGIGMAKADSLVAAMRAINPLPHYQTHCERVDESNVLNLIAPYDLILDGSDNFATRYLIADACYLQKRPLIQGAVHEYQGQLSVFMPDKGPCYRCVFQEPPARDALAPCVEVGVLGVLPGTVGLMMATEAIKHVTDLGHPIQSKLLIYQALDQTLRHITLTKNDDCPLCGQNPTILDVRAIRTAACPSSAEPDFQLSGAEARQAMAEGYFLLDVREDFEFQRGHLPGAVHLPLGQINADNAAGVLPQNQKKNQKILVYCQKGTRSQEAVRRLRRLGYTQTYSLAGGLLGWQTP